MKRSRVAVHTERIARLLGDELGAEVMLDVGDTDPTVMSFKQRVLAQVKAENHTTVRWADVDLGSFARLTVIYDFLLGPERGQWRKVEAKIIRQALVNAGVDVNTCNFVAIHDRERDTPSGGFEPPEATRGRVADTIAAGEARNVLLMGGGAMAVWHPQLGKEGSRCWGGTYLWANDHRLANLAPVFVRPVMHPGAVLRDLIPVQEWRRQIASFVQEADDGLELSRLATNCLICRENIHLFDTHGVGFCRDHLSILGQRGGNAGRNGGRQSKPKQAESLL